MPQDRSNAVRGRLLTFLHTPSGAGDRQSYRCIGDGIVLFKDGRVADVGPASELISQLPQGTAVEHHPGKLKANFLRV
jgi:guanine deaminase